ncbi:hypothetical protein Vadar_010355 [Vaccinium darrowii]|uniref:Uncharacterized protein n=1 Tax=Vaccinium darrowii TaxID=229202 RepID=A0ACB7ZIF5_9ERIC|nr:hypothetical protein Vadar_010355 [Vaccinium darrowii]
MNNQHRPPPPPPPPPTTLDLQSTTQILNQTYSIFYSHLLKFLALSFLIFTFRSNLDNGSHLLTDFIDQDPGLKTLFSSLDISAAAAVNHHLRRRQPRQRPFLQLTRVGTLNDDDLLSGDEDSGLRSLFGSHPRKPINGSSVILGDFDFRVIRSSLSFKLHEKTLQSVELKEDFNSKDELKNVKNADETERVGILQYLIKVLGLQQDDASALFFLVCSLSAAYGYVIVGSVVTYSWVLGIVFVVVVNHLLGRRSRSWSLMIWDGSYLGLKRLSGFILMRWAGFEKETARFLFAWLLLDMIVEFVFSVDPWVAIVDSRRSSREIVKAGRYLLLAMFKQAVIIKCLEYMLCGSLTRWTLAQYFGKMFTTAFQSIMEVFFMVAWLIFYFSVRSKDANSLGRTFGRRELEGYIQGHR